MNTSPAAMMERSLTDEAAMAVGADTAAERVAPAKAAMAVEILAALETVRPGCAVGVRSGRCDGKGGTA